jgi:hypothetical protein
VPPMSAPTTAAAQQANARAGLWVSATRDVKTSGTMKKTVASAKPQRPAMRSGRRDGGSAGSAEVLGLTSLTAARGRGGRG